MTQAERSLVAILLLGSNACESAEVECKPDQLRFAGRPPRRLFAFDPSCRRDCFSAPERGGCETECNAISLDAPLGALDNDDMFWLVDGESLAPERALVFRFGFVDDVGGTAPDGWSLLLTPRTYLADETQSTAHFAMESYTSIALDSCTTDAACPSGLCVDAGDFAYCAQACTLPTAGQPEPCSDDLVCGAVDPLRSGCIFADGGVSVGARVVARHGGDATALARPGRLELSRTDPNHLAGIFFLGFEGVTRRLEAQVNGCFDVQTSDAQDVGDGRTRRVLSP